MTTRSPASRTLALTSDLRIQIFAIMFAFGTLHHELEFVLEQTRVGPYTEYMERWSRAVPSIGWPSAVGIALHLANVAVAVLLLRGRWSRELLCLLAVVFFLAQLATPHRISSHAGLMAGGLLVILLTAMGEWLGRLSVRGRAQSRDDTWYRFTLTGLAWICALTYFFAFFYKLNPVWLSHSSSAAPAFLIRPLSPLLNLIGLAEIGRPILAAAAIYATLLIELLLPVLLWLPPARVLACLTGLVLHLPMIAQGVSDFPVLIVAFYPAFLTLSQTRELLQRVLARPSIARLAGTALVGGYGVLVVQRAAPELYSQPWLHPLVRVTHNALTCATFVAFVYVALAIGGRLVEQQGLLAPTASPPTDARRRIDASRASPATTAAAIVVLVCAAAFLYLNLGRFLGLPTAGAMSMYSGMKPDLSNHLIMPRVSLADSHAYAWLVRFESAIETPAAREFRAFTESLGQRRRAHQLNLNFLRYHLSRICASAPGGTVGLAVRMPDGATREFADACAEPAMLRYVPVPANACNPPCWTALRRWARGELGVR